MGSQKMGRSWLRLLAFLAFGLNIVMSQDADRVITELETKTDGDAYNAGMGPGGHIKVAVYTPEGICLTEILDSPHNDFESGHIDGFGKDDGLGRCYNYAPGASNSGWSIEIIHSGGDAWIGEYVEIVMSDWSRVHCQMQGEVLDNSESLHVDCV